MLLTVTIVLYSLFADDNSPHSSRREARREKHWQHSALLRPRRASRREECGLLSSAKTVSVTNVVVNNILSLSFFIHHKHTLRERSCGYRRISGMNSIVLNLRLETSECDVLDKLAGKALNRQAVARNLHVHVLQVVLARAANMDVSGHAIVQLFLECSCSIWRVPPALGRG